MKTKLIASIVLLVIIAGIAGYVLMRENFSSDDTARLYVYADGEIEATVLDLEITETKVEPIEMTDGTTGEKTFGPSKFYTINIILKINSVEGIDSGFLKEGDEIVIHYGWEANKPEFNENDVIDAHIELVGIHQNYDSAAYWRFENQYFESIFNEN